MINLETFLKCSSCFERNILYDNSLKYVYAKLENDIKSLYVQLCDGRCKTIEEYNRMISIAKERADTLQFLLDTDRKRV